MRDPGFPTRIGANGTPRSTPPNPRLEVSSSRGGGTRGGTNAGKSGLVRRNYRAGYRIRTGDLQLGKATKHPTTNHTSKSISPLSRPESSPDVAGRGTGSGVGGGVVFGPLERTGTIDPTLPCRAAGGPLRAEAPAQPEHSRQRTFGTRRGQREHLDREEVRRGDRTQV